MLPEVVYTPESQLRHPRNSVLLAKQVVGAHADDLGRVAVRPPGRLGPKFSHRTLCLHAVLI